MRFVFLSLPPADSANYVLPHLCTEDAHERNQTAAYKGMVESLKRFPSLLSHICFTFEPDGVRLRLLPLSRFFLVLLALLWRLMIDEFLTVLSFQPDLSDRNPHFIVLPNEPSKELFYLNTWVPDFAARLLRLMEDWVPISCHYSRQ
jgi:hypothetical protein